MNDVISGRPADDLERQVREVLEHAVDAQRRSLNPHFPSIVDIQCGEKAILL